jgi:hypothetical protein
MQWISTCKLIISLLRDRGDCQADRVAAVHKVSPNVVVMVLSYKTTGSSFTSSVSRHTPFLLGC